MEWGRCSGEKGGESICGEIPDISGRHKAVRRGWDKHQKVKRKEWHAGQFDRGKEDGKVISPVLFIPPFIPFSHLAKHKPSRWESGSLCLWLLFFVTKVTGFIPLGTAGTALKGETRTKCTTLPQHVDALLKECGTECETLRCILRSAFTRNWNTVFGSGRVTLDHHFKHLPSLCNKLTHLIYSSVNATASARHLRLWSSNSNQIWRLLRCICIISPAFMNSRLPIMGSSWKADRKWQLWKKCGYWCLSGRAASFQRTIRVKFWGKELRLSLSSWQFTTWKSVNLTNVKKLCVWIGSLGDH